jgi:hypothetical protein
MGGPHIKTKNIYAENEILHFLTYSFNASWSISIADFAIGDDKLL